MHLISWNVASWKTTLEHINENHCPALNHPNGSVKSSNGNSSSKAKSPGSGTGLDCWLRQLQVDVLCLQEVKVERGKVEELATALGARSAEYDCFFACPSPVPATHGSSSSGSSGAQTRGGLNGVATFVRKGRTCKADSNPLDAGGRLDREGRCIMTDHGNFCVFNVYIPNAAGGSRLAFKQQFQQALQAAMAKQRLLGKKCMLVGDFNLAYRPQDVHRDWRLLHLDTMLSSAALSLATERANARGGPTGAAQPTAFQRALPCFLQYVPVCVCLSVSLSVSCVLPACLCLRLHLPRPY
jgi:exonuclease III